jgi:hypothetical protein
MRQKFIIASLLIQVSVYQGICQKQNFSFSANLTVSDELREICQENGRLFLFFSENPNVEPRTQIWPNSRNKTHIFARNISSLDSKKVIRIDNSEKWITTTDWTLEDFPEGVYYIQILWDQDIKESRINAPGNLFSTKQKIHIDKSVEVDISLNEKISPRKIEKHHLVRLVDLNSKALTEWWDKPVSMKASILLPNNYNENKAYPIRYNIAGYGGRYTRIYRLVRNEEFMKWWTSDESPEIINVFLDGEGPFGDPYQMDSENNGPYGSALINELIPHIESEYRGTSSSKTRFIDGCSTGGWVSLGLQLFYPDEFNSCFSYSPDAVEFTNYSLVDIYNDENMFTNEYGYLIPIMRSTKGDPILSLKQFVQHENVLGSSGTYLNSGGQIGSHNALYSPKGGNGLPLPLFDPLTGKIDTIVSDHWKKYDFKIYVEENWEELGPKLQGKIFIWMGDMDNFYLNLATRAFADFINTTKNPTSDAEIIFTATEGHCSQYSHKKVLLQIQKRVEEITTIKAQLTK